MRAETATSGGAVFFWGGTPEKKGTDAFVTSAQPRSLARWQKNTWWFLFRSRSRLHSTPASSSKLGLKMVFPNQGKELQSRISAPISGCLPTLIYPGLEDVLLT